jgi:hypothetical protein
MQAPRCRPTTRTHELDAAQPARVRHAPGHPLLMLCMAQASLSTGTQSHLLNSPCRHRVLSRMRRQSPGHRLHRGPTTNRQDPGACSATRSAEHPPGAGPTRAPGTRVQPDVICRGRSVQGRVWL